MALKERIRVAVTALDCNDEQLRRRPQLSLVDRLRMPREQHGMRCPLYAGCRDLQTLSGHA
jgi:hypothetical protein